MHTLCIAFSAFLLLFATGCEDTNIWLATEAGIDAVRAVTLSDREVRQLAESSAEYIDREHTIAPPGNTYAQRLQRLVEDLQTRDDATFDYGVYLDDKVNAFAMADGTIRVYSGLMDMMHDDELRFVIGHEMGHVVKDHIRKKMQLAYAASAIRKGVASQNSVAGDLARSQLGGFAQILLGAQFSQLEEKMADDYGLQFLKAEGHDPGNAVAALDKLASLSRDHTFLSSHPEPDQRAERIRLQLQGKAQPIVEIHKGILEKAFNIAGMIIGFLLDQIAGLVSWLINLISLDSLSNECYHEYIGNQ